MTPASGELEHFVGHHIDNSKMPTVAKEADLANDKIDTCDISDPGTNRSVKNDSARQVSHTGRVRLFPRGASPGDVMGDGVGVGEAEAGEG